MDAVIQKTQSSLNGIVKRTPLTEKLLSRPPFKYLHDIISEIIKNTGFGKDLYQSSEMDSSNIVEKDAKISYLAKIIQLVESMSGTKVELNPSKVVAGKDPEITNSFLQQLSVLAKQAQANRKNSSTLSLNSDAKKSSQQNSKVSLNDKATNEKRSSNENIQSKASAVESPATNTEKETSIPPSMKSPPESRRNLNSAKSSERKKSAGSSFKSPAETRKIKPTSTIPTSTAVEETEVLAVSSPTTASIYPELTEDSSPTKTLAEEVASKRATRPTTARLGPPRKKEVAQLDNNPTEPVPVIMEKKSSLNNEALKEEEFVTIKTEPIGVTTSENSDTDQHSSLVRKLLETKTEFEKDAVGPEHNESFELQRQKEKELANNQISALKESIQNLCRNIHPLGKTLEYVQEDLDSISKELLFWKKEHANYAELYEKEKNLTKKALSPLISQLEQLEKVISEQNELIRDKKSFLLSNDATIQKMIGNLLASQ